MIRLIPLVALALTACAPVPPPQATPDCAADWRAQGLADGRAGRPAEPALADLAACPALAAGPAREAAEDLYLSGHDEGRALWCRAAPRDAPGRAAACPPELPATRAEAAPADADPDAPRRPRITPLIGLSVGVGPGHTHVGGGVGIAF